MIKKLPTSLDRKTIQLLEDAEIEFQRKDYQLAFQLFSSLIEVDPTGHSLFRIGIMYKYSLGTEIDEINKKIYIDKALPLLKTFQNPLTYRDLGFLYEMGEGVSRDLNEAFKLYKRAADQGNSNAQYYLGKKYECGQGVTKDMNEAIKLYKLSADQGYTRAQFDLARMYSMGEGVPKDEKEAFRLYKLSAEQYNSGSQNNLALMYQNGEGVSKDLNEALRLFKLSADQGHSAAMTLLSTFSTDE